MRVSRLKGRLSFIKVYRGAKKPVRLGCFVFYVCKNGLNYSRLGVNVSKRYVPLAVQRNYIKRIHRECFKVFQASVKGVDVIVVLRADTSSLTRNQLYQNMVNQWEQLVRFLSR